MVVDEEGEEPAEEDAGQKRKVRAQPTGISDDP
jgi:hypothetical protein